MTATLPAGPATRSTEPQVAAFRRLCAERAGLPLDTPAALHAWSVTDVPGFWRAFLDWADPAREGSADVVCTGDDVETATFFPGLRLNHAENLLRPLPGVDDDAAALTCVRADGTRTTLSRADLRDRVHATAAALARAGVVEGQHAVVVAPNNDRAAVAVLGLTALGAAVATCMPDMGPAALLGRLEQVEPALLLLDRTGATGWDGEPGDTLATLLAGLPSVRRVLVLDDGPLPAVPAERLQPGGGRVEWPRVAFDAPLFVMFSSGTTGPPKAMVHGVGGTLLEHLKEHRLHLDLGPADTLFFSTTTAWMMWNWQLSALAVGAHVVLAEGPVLGPETLWQLAADLDVTVLGTSPAYLQLCQDAGYRPPALPALRAVLSTGSVLHDWQYDWLADAVGDLPLQSISGGTDLIGCFLLGSPELPVRRGRCSTRSLGMDVVALDDGADAVGRVGELVCRTPFPSRPVRFLRDDDGARLHAAYYATNPGVWTHGDLVEFDEDGTARLHGRSDGVLNIDGVRIGPAEISAVLRALPEIADSMAVEQRTPAGSRLVLLTVLRAGARLDADLTTRIRATLRRQASAAHVPAVVLAVPDLPVTHNGKRSERAARDVLEGRPAANLSALKNPASLHGIAAALAAASAGARPPAREDDGPQDDDPAAVVARLWAEALGSSAALEGTFADLGGTSRQAMTLVRQVRLALGRDVSMADFLADPTLPGLTRAALGAAADASAVVDLAPGEAGLPPLFFLQDAWGDVDVYWPLARLLVGTGPVHGLRTPLAGPVGEPLTVDAIAAAAAAEIARAVPEGPVRLAGHSFGGLVAFATARVLAEAGREVDFVGLLDPAPPSSGLPTWQARTAALANQVASLVPGLRNRPLRELLRDRFRPGTRTDDDRLFGDSTAVYHAHRWRRYDRPVTYFRARRRLPVVQHWMGAWRAVAPLTTVVDVPGAHHDLLGVAHVDRLAVRFSAALPRG